MSVTKGYLETVPVYRPRRYVFACRITQPSQLGQVKVVIQVICRLEGNVHPGHLRECVNQRRNSRPINSSLEIGVVLEILVYCIFQLFLDVAEIVSAIQYKFQLDVIVVHHWVHIHVVTSSNRNHSTTVQSPKDAVNFATHLDKVIRCNLCTEHSVNIG